MRIGFSRLIVFGIAVRMVLAIYTEHAATLAKLENLDQLFLLGSNPLERGTGFGPSFYVFYSPFYLLYLAMSKAFGFTYQFWLDLLIKTPPLIGDVITAYALFRLALILTHNPQKARYLALVYFLNPYVIWITSIVGSADSLWVGFVLLSMVYLFSGSMTKAGFCLGFATMFRLLPLLLLPFFALYLYRRRSGALAFTLPYVVTSVIFGLPYLVTFASIYSALPSQAIPFLQHFIGGGSAVGGTGGYDLAQIETFTYNFTGVIANLGGWPSLSALFGFRAFLVVLIVVFGLSTRTPTNNIWLNRTILVTFGLFILLIPLAQNEYLSWILPFLLLEVSVSSEVPNFIPWLLTLTWLLIDPITQASFFYYPVFPIIKNATDLVNSWPLNVIPLYEGVSALNGLLIAITMVFCLGALVLRPKPPSQLFASKTQSSSKTFDMNSVTPNGE